MLPVTYNTVLDEANLKILNRSFLRDQQRKMLPFLIICSVLCLGIVIYPLIQTGTLNFMAIWAFVMIAALWALLYVFFPITYNSRTRKTLDAVGVRHETAVLSEEQMTTQAEGPKGSYEQSLDYSTFTKVWETPLFFLLFVGTQVVALDKRSVSEEENAAVRAFLQPRFPGKLYRILK